MDNPHTLADWELAYMACLLDCRGSITLERSGLRRLSGIMGLSPSVVVTSTNETLVEHTVQQMRRMGVNPHVKSQGAGQGFRRRTCYWVQARSLTKAAKILRPLKHFLIAKRAQADLVLEFIELRGNPLVAKRVPYGPAELRILDAIRALNQQSVTETEDHGLRRSQIAEGK